MNFDDDFLPDIDLSDDFFLGTWTGRIVLGAFVLLHVVLYSLFGIYIIK